jgi:hypothetical protein
MGQAKLAGRPLALAAFVSVALALLVAAVERAASPPGAADRALGAVFRFVVPLAAAALSGLAIGKVNLRDAAWPAARFGHARAPVAAAIVGASLIASALVSLVAALAALLVARVGASAGSWAMPLGHDVLTTSWIALLVGASYAAWLGLGAAFGKAGGGRVAVLVIDFVLGDVGTVGAVLPRGGATSLLGFTPPVDMPQWASSLSLAATTVACLALAAWWARDR